MSQSEQFREEFDDAETEPAGLSQAGSHDLGWAKATGPTGPVIVPMFPAEPWPERRESDGRTAAPLRGIILAVLLSLPFWALIAAIWLV